MEIETKYLKIFLDDRGYLFECLRKDDKIFDGEFGQALISVLFPGVVKGWHKHKTQTDYTICIKGNIKYCTAKEDKNGRPEIKTFFLGENNQIMVKVPPGIWHGYTPLANKEAILLTITDKTFDPSDTEKKDWKAFGDVWSVENK
jgi:dTDP-4-dehydrorhamnose 3,5-epimerase